ncbi:uncharacterized protein [Dermacentor andersoni]|uniref:uncharacterized protein n=1 Tax=Dermacentor andersoni TaxID=34620 RepID=UPI003B3B5E19
MAREGCVLAAIMDPYTQRGQLPKLPPHHQAYAAADGPLCAIVTRRPPFDVFPTHVSRLVVAVECSSREFAITVVAAYAPPHRTMDDVFEHLAHAIDRCRTPDILVMGDFNAHSVLWGPREGDDRGTRLIEFAAAAGLVVLNDASSPPTYVTKYVDSWIDVTIASPTLVRRGCTWRVSEEETLSEHRRLDIAVHTGACATGRRLTNYDRRKWLEAVRYSRWFASAGGADIASPAALDAVLAKFYTVIDRERVKQLRPPREQRGAGGKSWWTPELDGRRRAVNAMRRRFQRCRCDQLRALSRSQYSRALAEYRQEVARVKEEADKEVCNRCCRRSLFQAPFRLAFGAARSHVMLPPLTRQDGGRTVSVLESASLLLDHLFARDRPETDAPAHAEIRAAVGRPYATAESERPFSTRRSASHSSN